MSTPPAFPLTPPLFSLGMALSLILCGKFLLAQFPQDPSFGPAPSSRPSPSGISIAVRAHECYTPPPLFQMRLIVPASPPLNVTDFCLFHCQIAKLPFLLPSSPEFRHKPDALTPLSFRWLLALIPPPLIIYEDQYAFPF